MTPEPNDIQYRVHLVGDKINGYQHCLRCGVELSRDPLMPWDVGMVGQQMKDAAPTGGWAHLGERELESDEYFCDRTLPVN